MNKDPIRTHNAKKVLIKDQVLKIRTLLETVLTFKLDFPGKTAFVILAMF